MGSSSSISLRAQSGHKSELCSQPQQSSQGKPALYPSPRAEKGLWEDGEEDEEKARRGLFFPPVLLSSPPLPRQALSVKQSWLS